METPTQTLMEETRKRFHSHCIVCNRPHSKALGLKFQVQSDGGVSGTVDCSSDFEGYNGLLHGGVISSIADGAMTNCLFAHGVVAVTAELTVRFRHPVELTMPLEVTAWITRSTTPLYSLEAKLIQSGQLKARATAKFMTLPEAQAREIEFYKAPSVARDIRIP